MTFEPARPRYKLPFAGKEYELLGTFGLIEAVEYEMKAHVGMVAVQITNGMSNSDLTRVISSILTACGHKLSAKEAGEMLWANEGLTGDANEALRLHLYSFLRICLAPPGEREKRTAEMGEMMGKLNGPGASPGSNTAASA